MENDLIPEQVRNLKPDNRRRIMAILASKGNYNEWYNYRVQVKGMFMNAFDKDACKIAIIYDQHDFLTNLLLLSPWIKERYVSRYEKKYNKNIIKKYNS
jgi:hypothetical protein